MSIDFSQFGVSGQIDPSVLDDQGTGDYLLPDMKDAVLVITGVSDLSNSSGWAAANFEVQVANDGGSGEHNGKSTKYSITLANPTFPEGAEWGQQELKRWAAACGLTQLTSGDDMIGKQFMCNISRKARKKDPTQFDQKILNLRPVGTTAPAGGMAGGAPQGNPMQQQPQQPAAFAQQPQQQPSGNQFQQGGVPPFGQQ